MLTFAEVVRAAQLPIVSDVSTAPRTTGYYLLFGSFGHFIYVGKATDLHDRLAAHLLPAEPNVVIRQNARYAAWFPTPTIEEAEIAEGRIYDTWVIMTGARPLANENRPPRATADEQQAAVQALARLLALR